MKKISLIVSLVLLHTVGCTFGVQIYDPESTCSVLYDFEKGTDEYKQCVDFFKKQNDDASKKQNGNEQTKNNNQTQPQNQPRALRNKR